MLSNSQKEHLTYTAIGQSVTIALVLILGYQYILPGISRINTDLAAANKEIADFKSTSTDGISYDTLGPLLGEKPNRLELVKIIQSDIEGTKKAIKKEGTDDDYLTWLTKSIGQSDGDKQILIQEKAKLNSIVPTMSPVSSNIEEENVTLKQYVKFIEGTILKKFNFESNVAVSMQGITLGTKGGAIPESIGTLDFRFDFKGTNSDISRFIEYINNSGKPDLLINTGALISKEKTPGVMSNPLITVTAFSVQNTLDKDNPNGENSGRVGLKFYVRGISKDDITFLRAIIKTRQDDLGKKIEESLKGCEKDGAICVGYQKKLAAFKVKYMEFKRSRDSAKVMSTGTEEVYVLSQDINTLKSLEKELDSILPKSKK